MSIARMQPSIAFLVLVAAAVLQHTSAFSPRPFSLIQTTTTKPAAFTKVGKPLFGLEEELEGEIDEGGVHLAAEFYDLERGKKLTEKDLKDLENDDLDPRNLVVREDIDKVTGDKIKDIEFTEDEDYSDNRSLD